MCGITGIFGSHRQEEIENSTETLIHRGRDDKSIHTDGDVSLGNRRLSIIDLVDGHQPMPNEDSTVWCTFNGEIYNFQDLRAELEVKGHQFRTGTDTEVILHAYEEYGVDCVKRFDGMFAFGLYDTKQRKLILARDRVGIKPLYYSFSTNRLSFASEAKALVDKNARLNDSAFSLDNFFGNSEQTYFQDVRELLPSHMMEITLDERLVKIRKTRYWVIPDSISHGDETRVVNDLGMLLDHSISKRLVSDVPIGVFLSGGLDSSLITALVKRYYPKNLVAFSVGMPDFRKNELSKAEKVAHYLGVPLVKVELSRDEIMEVLPKMVWHLEDCDPRNVELAVMNYYMSKKAAESGIRVILSGEGADEVYGGYGTEYSPNYQDCRELLMRWHSNHGKNKDRASMAVPVEIRAPFLDDTALLEYSMSIAPELKYKSNKYVLRQVARKYLPDWIAETPKGHGHILCGVPFAVRGDLSKRFELYKDMFIKIFREGIDYHDISL